MAAGYIVSEETRNDLQGLETKVISKHDKAFQIECNVNSNQNNSVLRR